MPSAPLGSPQSTNVAQSRASPRVAAPASVACVASPLSFPRPFPSHRFRYQPGHFKNGNCEQFSQDFFDEINVTREEFDQNYVVMNHW